MSRISKSKLIFIIIFSVFIGYISLSLAADTTKQTEQFTSSDCLMCHDTVKIQMPAHEKLECTKCHQGIKELPHPVPLSKVNCGACHEGVMGSFKEDPHARAQKAGNMNAPECTDCHPTHGEVSKRMKGLMLEPGKLDKFCSTCHAKVEAPEKYHVPLFPSNACLKCHGVKNDTAPFVDIELMKGSVHKGHECTDCHRGINLVRHTTKHELASMKQADCGICHKKEFLEQNASVHGRAVQAGIPAAKCWDCHGTHTIYWTFDNRSQVNYTNLHKTCGKCHDNPSFAEKYNIPIKNPMALYMESVHYQKVESGIRAAVCSDCHGIHNIEPHTNPVSPINKGNIPKTCSRCHESEYEDFVKGIHWRSYRKGVSESPVCIDCHSEHRILAVKDPKSPVYALNIPKTCSDCHERVRIVEKYGIPAMRLSSYLDSYHGLAYKAGNLEAANCVSCHSKHLILPSSDPESQTNKQNLPKTCGKCHAGIAQGKDIGAVHEIVNKRAEFWTQVVTIFYLLAICGTIGGMLGFCFLDFIKKVRYRDTWKSIYLDTDRVDNLKFNAAERWMHQFLFLFFIILVYTGFAHHFPDNPIFSYFVKWQGGNVRAIIHRICGSGLIILFGTQLYLMAFTHRGKKQTKKLIPKLNDVKEALLLFFYNLGFIKTRPELTHPFSFIEKFEFWALVWGNIIMAITGLLLWLTGLSLRFIPKWILDIFLLIHFYEAILASLAILVWHFYWTIFDPIVYPYNPVIFTKKVPPSLVENLIEPEEEIEEEPIDLIKEDTTSSGDN
ncbi:MAG: cytochrome b/b6 domain-containing protein [bacterium]